MRKCLLLMFCAAAYMPQSVLAIAASQVWVENYVSNYVARAAATVQAGTTVVSSNGVMTITAGEGTGKMWLVIQDFSDAALIATNCTAAAVAHSITNGTLFVWDGGNLWRNPGGTIEATQTNLVFEGVSSVATNGVERFAGWFDAYGVLIQPDTSLSITNGMTEVTR